MSIWMDNILKSIFGINEGFPYFSVIMLVAETVLTVASLWKIFEKAGERGWKALIPVLNNYTTFKIAWRADFMWIYIVATFLGDFLRISAFASGVSLMLFLAYLFNVVAFVFQVGLSVKLVKAFGYSGGYAVGLILVPIIFLPIIAFEKSRYVRNETSEHPSYYMDASADPADEEERRDY